MEGSIRSILSFIIKKSVMHVTCLQNKMPVPRLAWLRADFEFIWSLIIFILSLIGFEPFHRI